MWYTMLMPTTTARKTRHTALRPKHKQTKKYLKVYWPYLPLVVITFLILSVWQPWQSRLFQADVLPYATDVSISGLLESTNARRSRIGVPQLQLNTELSQAAQAKAYDMAVHNYWAHTAPDGTAPWQFINNAGYNYKKAGENLAYGFDSSNSVVGGWMNSPSHRDNILDPSYQHVGFGFVDAPDFDNNGSVTVVVALYAQPSEGTDQPVVTSTDQRATIPTDNTLGSSAEELRPQSISRIQTLAGSNAPWVHYVVGVIIGAAAMFLIVKHGVQIRRALVKSENFIVHHPVLDLTIIAVLVLGLLIIQRVGVIL